MPVELDKYIGSQPKLNAVASQPVPTISSITGVSNAFGVTNGRVNLSCGDPYANGSYAINDLPGSYPLTLNGNNFGASRGTVTFAGQNVSVLSWTNTRIVIDPTFDWRSSPMSAVFRVQAAIGATLNSGLDVVLAIRTKVYGQCTYFVAKTRLELGLQPSPTTYGGYIAINGNWSPRAGDQLQWSGGSHTGIITSASGPTSSAGGVRTWNLTISEQNANCSGGINRYAAQFQTRTTGSATSVTIFPKSSIGSYPAASLYYR